MKCEEIFQVQIFVDVAKCILLTRAITITTTTNNTRLRGGQETAGHTTQRLGKVMITGKLLNTTTGETDKDYVTK